LDFLVTPEFFRKHPDTVEAVQSSSLENVSIHSITETENLSLATGTVSRHFRGWSLFCDYLVKLKANHGLLLYYDHFQLPCFIGKRCTVPYSAIYFRPTFHYSKFDDYKPSLREKIRDIRKRWLFKRSIGNSSLRMIYCLDKYAVSYMQEHMTEKVLFCCIADSFATYSGSRQLENDLHRELGIDKSRTMFLLLGVLDERKGVLELLQSLKLINSSDASGISIVLAGPLSESHRERVLELIAQIRSNTDIQVILQDRYIRDYQVQHYYELANVVLATYQKHMGSSSALIRAAMAEKQILSSNYGLMGQLVKEYNLGISVDTSNINQIANGITQCLRYQRNNCYENSLIPSFLEENSNKKLAADLNKLTLLG